ncbi:MAG TPA: zf-HC2 domain-containing protein [Ktedonobacterales bacterium]
MSDYRAPSHIPAPRPLCAVYAPMLLLLSTGALSPEEERAVREHLADCAWCQNQRAAYDVVEQALREHAGESASYPANRPFPFNRASPTAEPAQAGAKMLTLEDIVSASQRNRTRNEGEWSGDPSEPGLRIPPGAPRDPRGRRPLVATLVAVAATLLIVILAASLFTRLGQRGPSVGSSPGITPTVPAQPTCSSNFANSPIQGVQTSVEGVPLPPVTYVVPDNAAGLHGYDLCSSGTASSVSAFLTSSLPASGWSKASDSRCFYPDECWTKGGNAISWTVGDPTDWHIAYHPTVG